MKEIPIIMSTAMVKAILDGAKNTTFRLIKPQPCKIVPDDPNHLGFNWKGRNKKEELLGTDAEGIKMWCPLFCPYGQVGDRLWLRETFWSHIGYLLKPQPIRPSWPVIYYDTETDPSDFKTNGYYRKHPSIFMPRWASRITLERTEPAYVKRALEITEEEAKLCGFESLDDYRDYWNYLNKKRGYGWDTNPWCWGVPFGAMSYRGK